MNHSIAENFVAIDFETANNDPSSACALAVIVVAGNTIKKKLSWLIRPPSNHFIFTSIHGITWNDVKKERIFKEIWPEVEPVVNEATFIAAHNASFDRTVLYSCCKDAGTTRPEVPFLCTVRLARKAWSIFPTRLPDVCKRLSIPLVHHDATSDAHACATIVIQALEQKRPFPNLMRPAAW